MTALLSKRLRLRDIDAGDWQALYRNEYDEGFQRFNDQSPMGEEAAREMALYLDACNRQNSRREYYLAITLRASGAMIGAIKLVRDRAAEWQAEVGYWVESRLWGQGYATEATRAMLDFGFGELKLHRIYAVDVIAENIGSARVLEKAGMRREAHFRDALYFKGRYWDTYHYAILEDEWRQTRLNPQEPS